MIRSFCLFLLLLIYFVILNILDGHSTYLVVTNSSLRSERNPIARFIFKKFGLVKGIFALKSIIVFLIPLMVWVYKETPKDINIVLIGADTVYSAVVINNYRHYIKICRLINPNERLLRCLKRGFCGK